MFLIKALIHLTTVIPQPTWLISFLRQETGAADSWGMGTVIGFLIFAAAYYMFPDTFHNFIQFLLNTFFGALSDSFGNEVETPVVGDTQADGVIEQDPYRSQPPASK